MEETTNIDNMIKDRMIRMQLSDIRKSKKLSQQELSKISGLSVSCISNIESVDSNVSPTVRSLIRYANALNADLYIKLNK